MGYQKVQAVAIVTGGSSGIGSAIAHKLATKKITVIVADIVAPKQAHQNIIYRFCDVTKASDVDGLHQWMVENTGLPDIVVLNAGRGIHEQLLEGDPEKWLEVLNLNLMGTLRCIRSFVPHMIQNKRGNVVFISSVSANQPYAYGAIYSASKAAMEMIAETLRLETLPHVKVTVVSAGVTDTDFFKNLISGKNDIKSIGMGALAADDIAADVWYAINKKGAATVNRITTRPLGQGF